MKAHRSSSKSGLFLIELIIAIVFFAVASAICTQLFVKAHLISKHSGDLNTASNIVQTFAEDLKSGAMDDYPEFPMTGSMEFDADGRYLEGGGGGTTTVAYRLRATYTEESGMITADLVVSAADTDEPIYTLQTKYYPQGGPIAN